MEKVSAVIITKNEEKNLPDCLESVKWADEILVVDSFSADRTVEIAQSSGARVLQRRFTTYPDQKNWAYAQASHPWIINLDADERVTDELRDEIIALLRSGPVHDAYYIYRRNYAFGYEIRHGGWNQDKILRFLHRDRCRYSPREVHADIELHSPPGMLRGKIIHLTYGDFDDYFKKFGAFTSGTAVDMQREGKRGGVFQLLFNPAWSFLRMYVFRLGFLDGRVGLILAVLSAFYTFTKYAKLWLLQRPAEEPPAGS